jgi:F-type H+-transporting ATPase subunit gamma
MTRRHDLERHRRSLDDIGKIIHSMQTLAFLETRKLVHCLENQRRLLQCVERTAADFLSFHPCDDCADLGTPFCLLIGSERGFCGDFNERLVRFLDGPGASPRGPYLIAVGRRLCTALAGHPRLAASLDGAAVSEETGRVMSDITGSVRRLQERHGLLQLTAVHHRPQPEDIARLTLLPPFRDLRRPARPPPYPPLLNLAPREFLVGLAEHLLFTSLHGILYASLMAENQRRVQQLEGAARHLERRSAELQRKGARLRQEEIIEEIEVLLLGAAGLRQTGDGPT